MEWALPAMVCFCVFTLLMSVGALALAANSWIDVKALKASTHRIEYVPVDPYAKPEDDDDGPINRAVDRGERDGYRDLASQVSDDLNL